MDSSSGVKTELVASRDRHRVALPDPTSAVSPVPHATSMVPPLPSVWCSGSVAVCGQNGTKGRGWCPHIQCSQCSQCVPPHQGHVPSAAITGLNTCHSSQLCPSFGMAVEWESRGQEAMPAHFLCLQDTQKRGFPIPPPLLPGWAAACAAPMPPTEMPPVGMPRARQSPHCTTPTSTLPGGSTPENPCAASSQGTGGGCNLWLLAGITPARQRARSPASSGTAAAATGFGTASMPAPVSEQGMR